MKGRLDSPSHIAAYFLNPFYFYKEPSIASDLEVMEGFIICVETFYHGDFEKQDLVVNHELNLYKNKSGPFGRSLALNECEKKDKFDPGNWWATYGCGAPTLQRLARRIFGLTSSFSGCERNWSCFEGIHTKRRNRLGISRLNSLVYVKFNAKLLDKKRKTREKNADVIFDDANEDTIEDWIVGRGVEQDKDSEVINLLSIQAPKTRDLYDDDFESEEEEDVVDMDFEPDVFQEEILVYSVTQPA